MTAEETKKVPPNGKWGWMIVLAYALNGISTTSLLHGLGLVFKDTFPLFGFNATQAAIIINTNLASGMILGLINGPLLRTLGYRKAALLASSLYTTGIIVTAYSRSFVLILIFYGLFTSLGMWLSMSAFSFALNSYFTTKRGRAMSLALTIVGLGPIILPQITTVSLSYYGFQDTILLFGAFSLHSLVGCTLLQPLNWHMKTVKVQPQPTNEDVKNEKETLQIDEKNTFQEDNCSMNSILDINYIPRKRKAIISTIDHDAEIGSIYGFDVPYARQYSDSISVSLEEKTRSQLRLNQKFKSVDTINLGSSVKIFDEKPYAMIKCSNLNLTNASNRNLQEVMENETLLDNEKAAINTEANCTDKFEEKSLAKGIFNKVVEFFDLNLLRDPIFVNIMAGMSAAIFAEANFSTLTPFILTDMKLTTKEISTVLSIIATMDLLFRTLAPFLGEWLHQPPRIMYMISLVLLIITRSSLIFANGFTSMIPVAIGLGAAKGIRSIYMSLVIPHYVPINRLPSANGIQMIMNGTIFLIAGPIVGIIRDNAGYYAPCIVMMNSITALTLIIWSVELIIVRRRKLRLKEKEQDNS